MLSIIRIVIASVVLIAQPLGGLCDVDAALPKAGTQSLLAQEMEAKKDILEKHVTLLETQMYELDEKIKQVKTQLEEDKQTEASLDARLEVHKEGKEKNIKLQSDTLVAASAKAHAKVEKGFGEEAPHLKHKGCEKEKESSHKASQVSDIDSETPEKDDEESNKKDAEGDDDADKQVDDANKEVEQQEDKDDDGDSLLAKTAKQTAEEVKEPGSKGSSFLQENAKASSTPDDDLSIMEPLQENSARMERYYNLLQEQLKKARTVIKYKTVMIEKEENDLVLLKTLQEAIEEGKKVLRDGQKTTIQHMFSALKETAAAATEGQKDEKDEDKNEDNAEDKNNDASKPAEDKNNDASKQAEDKNNDASKPAEDNKDNNKDDGSKPEDKKNDASKPEEDKNNDANKPADGEENKQQ